MHLKLPKPTVDIDKIRRLYHAENKGKARGKAQAKRDRAKS